MSKLPKTLNNASTTAGFEFVTRHDVRRTDDYWFEIDEYRRGEDKLLLVHLQFFRWTPSVLKTVIREFKQFRQHVRAPLFACPPVDDAKWRKFVSMMGYHFLQNIECGDGFARPLYIHTT
jgi:hypothetical protein